MLDVFARKISKWLSSDDDEQEICSYGIEILISNGLLFLSITIISVVLQQFVVSVYFTALFALLRIMLPGFHCEKYIHCYFFSLAIYLFFIGSYSMLQLFEAYYKSIGFILISCTVAFFLNYCFKRNCSKNGKICFFFYFVWSIALTLIGESSAAYPILYCMIVVVALLYIKKFDRRQAK